MNMFSIVKKNIKYNFYQYFLYLASMTLSITIYFTFLSLQYNNQIILALTDTDKLQSAFGASSILLLLFVSIFIWYSNNFFVKRRKKDIGLYSLLGVEKKQIGRMLFYENFIMGILALFIGLAIGELFSVFFSMILVKLMGFSIAITFTFNSRAIIQTLLVFSVIIFLTSLQGYFIIYRFKLIELFHATKKGEKINKPSLVLALLAIAMVGGSYWLLLQSPESSNWGLHFNRTIIILIISMIIGSFLLFHSLSAFFFVLLQKNKSFYFKWSNLLTFTQLTNRLKSNAFMFTIISILNAGTLIAFGFAYSIYYNTLDTMKNFVPYSYQYESTTSDIDAKIRELINKEDNHSLVFEYDLEYTMVKGEVSELSKVPGGYFYFDESFAVISNETYNQLVEKLDLDTIAPLKKTEALTIINNFIGSQDQQENVNKSISLHSSTDDLKIKIADNKSVSLLNDPVQPFIIVVNDSVYSQFRDENPPTTVHTLKVTNEVKSAALTKKIMNVLPSEAQFISFSDSYQEAQSVYGLLIFISGFLGLVFLAASGSMIYFKMLTEVTDDKVRYTTLKKLGVQKSEIMRVIAKQYSVVFLLPLIVGITHSCMILTAISNLMDINFIIPVIICIVSYTILYISYYVLTIISCNKIVNA
ncbi:FtsX-like permease family protein [Viridibacillus arvi]|uniref:FtsX-like permease family protein n=1 Tax=Viridibacillus arvi TaxID=263475 RepID=UPI0037F8511E